MIVCDASVLVEALLRPGPSSARLAGEPLAAPHLVDLEVASALRKLTLAGEIPAEHAAYLLDIDARFEIERYAHRGLLARIWELRHNLTTYDAAYIALSEVLEVPLVTLDSALAAVPGARCTVEIVPAP